MFLKSSGRTDDDDMYVFCRHSERFRAVKVGAGGAAGTAAYRDAHAATASAAARVRHCSCPSPAPALASMASSESYKRCELVGKGSFGEVFRGIEIATGKECALKLVDLEVVSDEIEGAFADSACFPTGLGSRARALTRSFAPCSPWSCSHPA
jgi:hypothetical protein